MRRALAVATLASLAAAGLVGCSSGGGNNTSAGTTVATKQIGPAPRVPDFAADKTKESRVVKVLSSLDPTVIIQFPLIPSGIKDKFPDATALVTVVHGSEHADFDTVTVDVDKMPPNSKFTVFFTELAAKPFGHSEYVGDIATRGDGTGEGVFHLIALQAFAADNNNPVSSADQSGDASGVQLEHVGMWFDSLDDAKKVLGDNTLQGTPFDGNNPPLHAGPQAMTDGETLAVL